MYCKPKRTNNCNVSYRSSDRKRTNEIRCTRQIPETRSISLVLSISLFHVKKKEGERETDRNDFYVPTRRNQRVSLRDVYGNACRCVKPSTTKHIFKLQLQLLQKYHEKDRKYHLQPKLRSNFDLFRSIKLRENALKFKKIRFVKSKVGNRK